jgi:hypothetical protein
MARILYWVVKPKLWRQTATGGNIYVKEIIGSDWSSCSSRFIIWIRNGYEFF